MISRRPRYTKTPRYSNRTINRRNGHQKPGYDNRSKIRGNPSQVLNKYLVLAKDALTTGDSIQAEYYYQYTDHYTRIMSENGFQFKLNKSEGHSSEGQSKELNTKDYDQDSLNSNVSSDESNSKDEEFEDKDKSLDTVSFLSEPLTKR